MTDYLNKQVVTATKWSAITEILAKLVAPITHMVLARLLTPEAFGVVATIQMVISFADVFSDAGFQKYIQQRDFRDEDEKNKNVNVAFWTNLMLSMAMWIVIIIYRNPISNLVGSPGTGVGLSVACICIPLTAFSSIQMALFKRNLDFKTLFVRRLIALAIPFVITIPLAIILRNYWALVVGNIMINISNAILLTVKSPWKPQFFYSIKQLVNMSAFCGWMLFDSVLVWMTGYIDVFLVGAKLGSHYLGLYKTSMNTVTQFTSVITAAILPVMLPALSKVQNDIPQLRQLLLKFQKYCSVLLLPIGVVIWAYSDLITMILLGEQWMDAAPFIGLWGIMEVVIVIFSRFCTVVYPAIGKPKYSVLAQSQYLLFFIPAIIYAVGGDFQTLCYVRAFIRIEGLLFNMLLCFLLIKLSPFRMAKNISPELFGCMVMVVTSLVLKSISSNAIGQLMSAATCLIMYCITLYFIPSERKTIQAIKDMMKKKSITKNKN